MDADKTRLGLPGHGHDQVSSAEELAAKVRRFALLDMSRPGATPGKHRQEADAALSELVRLASLVGVELDVARQEHAKAEALAEALERIAGWNDSVEAEDCPTLRGIARTALARHRGEK
jgi:hypothetical protein